MAHPYLFGGGNIELLDELIEKGKLDGIEVDHFSANDEQREYLRNKCAEHGLIATGGSDFHGLYNQVSTYIGSCTTDEENLAKLFDLIQKNKQSLKKPANQ